VTADVCTLQPTSVHECPDMSTSRSKENWISTFSTTLHSQQLVLTMCTTESRPCTPFAAPSNLLTHTQTNGEWRRKLHLKNVRCDIVVVSLGCVTTAGVILCRHMHKQARSASLPFQTFGAPHVTLATAADHMHQKKHAWHKQQANSIGKSHGI
jgi:hypothetical protein